MAAKKGALAGRYRLLEPAGHHPGAEAWRAKDELLDRFVVVARLPPGCPFDAAHSDRVRAKAIRDARAAVRLHHPHVVVVHDVFEQDLTPYVVTEDLATRTLAELVERQGSFPPDRVAALGAQLASALAAAHAAGIRHRGLGPDKVLLTADGTAKIAGFGLSTGGFPAPEVAGGASPGFAADVYSLGATLYFALEGRVPGTAVPPRASGPVLDALLPLVRPEPATRPSMAEAERTLTGLAVPRPPSVAEPRSGRNRARVLVTGTVLVVALGTAVTTRAAFRRLSTS
ncbi:Protein kinase domain-containing protein [Amycolatopsis tolypomycina]|uniref:non-specific serine/threonine protein kinase n=1 Tax=Amycolatopsis tolypomycina TaxID=208445 RepID=A0A1H4T5J2_9PSEU|nr:protein kinase [Amycolatopsis tolypomycina]SEC51706.1 Protein kinase domain-containing protein [Amycolatopsis tolypomycina]